LIKEEMKLIADLHLHSKYSRAVSSQMVIPEIARWAKIKGIDLVGLPDWTHPLWLRQAKEELEEAGRGLFQAKSQPGVLFILSTEIASIYSQNGQTRRIHNLVLAPSFAVVEKINTALKNRGANLISDGRPITGISSRDLTALVMEADKDCLVISAHAWTPWFSLYGSRSGFDSIKECYQEMSKYIYAIETGLSSDPAMNWRIGELDDRSLVSFSDAHSPAKLGREATVFNLEAEKPSYQEIKKAIQNQKIAYTIEFYPQEGKYHYTGHRQCGVKQSPQQTRRLGRTCPVCGKELTLGVMHRVEELATRSKKAVEGKRIKMANGVRAISWANRPPYLMLVPLQEILSESLDFGVASQAVQTKYHQLIAKFGSEFEILLEVSLKDINRAAGEKVAEGIKRVRQGDLVIDPGYDGLFGTVKIWGKSKKESKKQLNLF